MSGETHCKACCRSAKPPIFAVYRGQSLYQNTTHTDTVWYIFCSTARVPIASTDMSFLHAAPIPSQDTDPVDAHLQRALREQKVLLDSAGAGIVFLRQRRVVRCNLHYAEIFGYHAPEQLVGHNSESFHPDREAFRNLGRAAYALMADGQSYRTERSMRRRDGSLFWARLTGSLIHPQDPSEGSIWIVDDIDEQRNAQVQLEAALWETQVLFDNALVGIVFLRDRRLTRCNRHFEQMLGYGPGELLGSLSRRWYPSDAEWEAAGQDCYAPLSQGRSFEGEIRLRKKDGSIVVCDTRSRAADPAHPQHGSVWIAMDITERQNAQAALVQAHQKMEQLVNERTQQLSTTVQDLHREINDRRQDQEHIYWLAHYDALTGLPNRTLLAERSQHAINAAQQSQSPLAVIFLDLDHFKHVNDSLGHQVGDALLVAIAQRLRSVVRDKDTVCRLGGDEFILLLPGANAQGAARVAQKLQDASLLSYQIDHHELTMAPSIGIALFPDDGADFDTLSQCADVAMYRAKLDGRNTYRFFTPQMQVHSQRVLQLENALRRALEREQFTLVYQPQICIATGQIKSVEALLRWTHPELGSIAPDEFIRIAEDCGQILPMGEWVLRTALAQLKAWRAQGLDLQTMAVNLSAVQFRQPQLPELITRILEELQLPPDSLELELTEGVALDDPRAAIATMDQLHARGVRLSIDDFGTGYSSLSQLKRFPIYKLKIDRSFVCDLSEDAGGRAIVSAIIRMAQALGMQTTAEGVETEGQLEFLREQGCTEAQGYYCGRPMPAAQLQALLQRSAA